MDRRVYEMRRGSSGPLRVADRMADTAGMTRQLQIVDAVELVRAYAAAEYAVAIDGDTLALRVGEPARDLEAYWPATRYAFITAWNPASEPATDAANETADALLVAQLDAAGAARQPAWAQDGQRGWREPGWLLADVEDHVVDVLAREFGQAGVLAWNRGEPVRLRMMIPRPRYSPDCAHTDWLEPLEA